MVCEVEVYNFTGERKLFPLDQSTTVGQLRGRLVEEFPTIQGKQDDVGIRFEAKSLTDATKLLSNYGIRHKSVIHLTLKVHGG